MKSKFLLVCVLLMGLSVAIDGQRVRIRIKPVASAGGDLSSLPLVAVTDIVGSDKFDCGILPPDTASNGLYTNFGPRGIAYNSTTGKLFISERENAEPNYVAEIDVSGCAYATTVAGLPIATYSQAYTEVTEGRYTQADDGNNPGAGLWALFVFTGGSKLYGNYFKLYDNVGVFQIEALFSHSTTLATSSVQGMVQIGSGDVNTSNAGYTSGYFMEIPSSLRSYFGGHKVMTGQCCPSIVTRSSIGHSLGIVDIENIDGGSTTPLTWTPIIQYSTTHPTLGCWDSASIPCDNRGYVSGYPGISLFNYATDPTGCVMFPGTRTTACLAIMGANDNAWACYGDATSNPALHGTLVGPSEPGELYCYDPTNGNKGEHNWPYRNVILLYNTQNLVDMYSGAINPATGLTWREYDAVPYAFGEFEFPVTTDNTHFNQMLAIAYDVTNNHIWLTQNAMKTIGCCIQQGAIWRITPDLTP